MKALRVVTALLLLSLGGWTQVGVNFRSTLVYVTDGTNECFANRATAYPDTGCTSAGDTVTMGWTIGTNRDDRDRDTGVVRLAGTTFDNESFSDITTWRLNLPGGGLTDCTIRAAFGDALFSSSGKTTFVKFCDGVCGTAFKSINTTGPGAAEFHDADGNLRASAATWVSSNTAITHSFSNSYMTVEISDAATGFFTPISHLFISCTAPASGNLPKLQAIGED